jgi:hypothetical protein
MQRSRLLTWTVIAFAAAALLSPLGSPAARADAPDPLVAMFQWWNGAYKQKDGFTAESFSRYFTPDAVMRINGKDRCRGLEDLAQHFRDIQARTEMVAIDLHASLRSRPRARQGQPRTGHGLCLHQERQDLFD